MLRKQCWHIWMWHYNFFLREWEQVARNVWGHCLPVREVVRDPLNSKNWTATSCGSCALVCTKTVFQRKTTRFVRPRGSALSSWFAKPAVPFSFCIGRLLISGYGAKLLMFPLCLSDRMHADYTAHASENFEVQQRHDSSTLFIT
jgi:hypothetical protein